MEANGVIHTAFLHTGVPAHYGVDFSGYCPNTATQIVMADFAKKAHYHLAVSRGVSFYSQSDSMTLGSIRSLELDHRRPEGLDPT